MGAGHQVESSGDELSSSISTFGQVSSVLRTGMQSMSISPPPTSELSTALLQLEEQWERSKDAFSNIEPGNPVSEEQLTMMADLEERVDSIATEYADFYSSGPIN